MASSSSKDPEDEEALRRSTVLERMTEGIMALDSDLRYTYVNDRGEQILDTDRNQLIGQQVWDAFSDAKGTGVQEAIEDAMATQEKQSFEHYNSTLDRWFEVQVYPDESGLLLYFADITERKHRQRALEKSRRYLKSLFEGLPDGVVVHDADGKVIDMNEEAIAHSECDDVNKRKRPGGDGVSRRRHWFFEGEAGVCADPTARRKR